MGWNKGYSIMEETVIAVYDAGVLTKKLLHTLMQPYVYSDIDHGGCRDLCSRDGLSADEIICKVMEPERFAEIGPVPTDIPDFVQHSEKGYFLPDNELYVYPTWEEAIKNSRDAKIYELWFEIVSSTWDIY